MTEQQPLLNACNIIEDFIKDEFIKQGHSMTQEWENSVVSREGGGGSAEVWATTYGMIVNQGVPADRIPYAGAGDNGGVSKYILGLVRFWQLRKPGITEKQALKLAFATAEVQKQEGMSTIASEEYSATGNRQRFLEAAELLFKDYVDNFVFEGLDVMLQGQSNEPNVMHL